MLSLRREAEVVRGPGTGSSEVEDDSAKAADRGVREVHGYGQIEH